MGVDGTDGTDETYRTYGTNGTIGMEECERALAPRSSRLDAPNAKRETPNAYRPSIHSA